MREPYVDDTGALVAEVGVRFRFWGVLLRETLLTVCIKFMFLGVDLFCFKSITDRFILPSGVMFYSFGRCTSYSPRPILGFVGVGFEGWRLTGFV